VICMLAVVSPTQIHSTLVLRRLSHKMARETQHTTEVTETAD